MERRRFLIATSALLAAPTAPAQSRQNVRSIGYLSGGIDYAKRKTPSPHHQAFLRGLAEKGFVAGKNVSIEYRFAEERIERLPALAAELVERKVEVIFGWATAAFAAAKATQSIPVVFTAVPDPVASGLVKSFSRPGGNVTGLSNIDLSTKRLELLKAAVPTARRVAYLAFVRHARYGQQRADLQAAALSLDVQLRFVEMEKEDGLAAALDAIPGAGADALLVQDHTIFTVLRKKIADFALERRLPTMGESALHAQSGFLMSYSQDFVDTWRRAGGYVARILQGAAPAELPVEQPTKFELLFNMKTAKTLGLAIPPSLLLAADRVIG